MAKQDWAKRTGGGGSGGAIGAPRRRIVYGSTDLVTAEEFVTGALARLGQESA